MNLSTIVMLNCGMMLLGAALGEGMLLTFAANPSIGRVLVGWLIALAVCWLGIWRLCREVL